MNRRILLLFLVALVSVAGAQRSEPHHYDLQNVSWRIAYDQSKREIHGRTTNTIVLKEAAPSVWFDLGPMDVQRVTVNGVEVPAKHDHDRLTVPLPSSSHKGERIQVEITYHGAPTAGVYFVDAAHAYPATSGMVYTQGEAEDNRYWLPTYDFPDDKATAECWIDVPAGQFALSNGKLIGIEKAPTVWTYHWKIDEPISTYLISFVAGDYVEGPRESVGRLPVQFYVPRGTEGWGEAAFGGTSKIVDFYNRLTGFRYPFEKFSQSAVADFMFGGMENASCVTQTIHALHKPENEPLANSEGLVAHELAHQWFGDTVTCVDWSHAWLNEGFASFLPNFYVRKAHGQDAYDAARYRIFQGALASQEATKRPVVSRQYDVPMDLFDGQIYGGGAARLFTLMGQLGEKTFWQGVGAYLEEYRFKNASTEDFFRVMGRVAKRDLSLFRDQFFYGSAVPQFTVSRHGSDVVIRQSAPGYDLDLTLSFLGRDEIVKEMPVHLHGAESVVSCPGLEQNLLVLDYPVSAMARIAYDGKLSSQDLLRIFRLAPNAAAKLTALDRFGTTVSPDDLLLAAREEKSEPVLAAILPRLNRESVPLLVQISKGFDRNLASVAVEALGNFADDPQAHERLREVWKKDSNELLRNSALESLLGKTSDSALASEAMAQSSQDELFRRSALRWFAHHEKDFAREKCLSLVRGDTVEPLRNEAIEILGSLKDRTGERRVFDALMVIAAEPSYAARLGAVRALASYGDPKAIPVIEPLTKSSLFFTRRAGSAAIAQLRGH